MRTAIRVGGPTTGGRNRVRATAGTSIARTMSIDVVAEAVRVALTP
jgi:hypothetical protein